MLETCHENCFEQLLKQPKMVKNGFKMAFEWFRLKVKTANDAHAFETLLFLLFSALKVKVRK